MTRCRSGWGALLCVAGLYAALTVAVIGTAGAQPAAYPCTQGLSSPPTAAEVRACLDDIKRQAQDVGNAMARQRARIDALSKAVADPAPQPDPDPVPPEPPIDPAPQPDPGPVPEVPPPGGISIDGAGVASVPLGTITTPTGQWPVDSLGAVADGKAYLFRYAARPDWWSICVVRWPDGSGSIYELAYSVVINGEASLLRVLPGSMKCVDNGEPVAPSMERLRQALAARRTVPYSVAAFSGWPKTPSTALKKAPGGYAYDYKPDRIYGQSSSHNALGIVSGQGGEYPSSRGFVSGEDAQLIAAAVDGNAAMFAASAGQNRAQMLWSLSLPNLAIWSQNHDMLRDPQIPLSGDLAYVNEGTAKTENYKSEGNWTALEDYPYLAEIGAKAGTKYTHGRNEEHLLNHGYAYWLATGDPRAAILQQAIAAYALASSYQGAYADGRYRVRFGYQRSTLNMISAMWKLRDVALNASGPLLWPKARAEKMAEGILGDWQSRMTAMRAATDKYSVSSVIASYPDRVESGIQASNFMAAGYGPEAAWLWASAGKPELLRVLAENAVIRFGEVGGTRGYYGRGDGTNFTLATSGEMLPYSDRAGFIAWLRGATDYPDTTFDSAPVHYVMRNYWLLRLAKDAVARGWTGPIPGLDAAIAKMEAARDRTTKWSSADVIGWKHAGVPFGE